MAIVVTWFAHSAFQLKVDDHVVLIDPFISGNPLATVDANSLNPELILLTHGHGDHLGDTVEIAKRTNAPVITNFEIANWLTAKGLTEVVGGNTGGWWRGEFLDMKFTLAFHTSSMPDGSYGGVPHGYVIETGGMRMYFAGDTALFSDMRLIGDMGIDVAFLPIGDLFTMGIDDSINAIELIRPRVVFPMHYNTFPPIMQDVVEWANRVNSETNATPVVLDPGGSYTVS